jgi:hypothetical protein
LEINEESDWYKEMKGGKMSDSIAWAPPSMITESIDRYQFEVERGSFMKESASTILKALPEFRLTMKHGFQKSFPLSLGKCQVGKRSSQHL